MELINWSISAIERIFYMIGLLMAGFLFFGFGTALSYQKIGKTAASKFTQPLSVEIKKCFGVACGRLKKLDQGVIQIEELNHNNTVRTAYVGSIESQTGELLRTVTGLAMRLDVMSMELYGPNATGAD